ncbi:hypothetical protein SAMN05661091_0690 [Paenibacillus uliginis N3/975]|uniref:Tetratricopeptide repeat-containing protein n=1 Tax=Paenibacillus uliginis N3/975 TaxID=1313296 RepID=A0A1X7GL93_9BACL|nr:DUF6483 family protein [Paenibacillus uliginis]SMF70972.1 hypothetical protein SAMN05661091_0690 [Paenibacillus uliginis N3/975]
MYRKDYLLRLVEEMTQMISKVFGLKQQKKHNEALLEINEMLSRQFRLNSKLLKSLSAEDIVQLFHSGGVVEADKLQSTARLLEEEADIYLDMDRLEDGNTLLVKALHLYLSASMHGGDRHILDMPRRINELLERVRPHGLPNETERLLFTYTEREGEYAAAEDSLYRLLQREAVDYREGRLFYERLLAVDKDELERGRLPITEVQEGLEELKLRYSHVTQSQNPY